MATFDIVNRVDFQEVDNAINNTLKDVARRYDFRGSQTTIIFDKQPTEFRGGIMKRTRIFNS